MRFTDRSLKALKPKEERYEIAETNGRGFRIRIFPSGKKSFIWRYKYHGKSKVMAFGLFPDEISLAEAHAEHAEAVRKLKKEGIDPGAVKQQKISAEKAAETVKELGTQYINRHAKKKKKSWQEDQRMLEKDIYPFWGKRKAKDIRRKDVIALLDGIVDRGAPIVANRTLEIIRRMFNFAIERDIVENNPCYMVKAPGKEAQRDRVLSPDELHTFWRRLYRTNMTPLLRLAIKFQLVTAQRRGEVMAAKWEDFDLDSGWWTIPETKNKLPHRVPLPKLAITLLRHIDREPKKSYWLFPNPSGKGPMTDRAPTRALARNLETLGIDHFTPHDLRRSAASQMASAGVSRLVISKVLNHAEKGVTAVYDRHSYDAEKEKALEIWSQRLQQLIGWKEASNVIDLRKHK